MKNIMDKYTIVSLKRRVNSNREVERIKGINKKTITKYWNLYIEQSELLNDSHVDIFEVQEAIVAGT